MTVDAIDCQGLGGGMTLGFVQAGMSLVRKVEQTGNFGYAQCDANRHLLGKKWDNQEGVENWEPLDVPIVFGNPPCSGFSMMSVRAGGPGNRGDYRGPQAAINSCMWELAAYAAKCNPEVIVMESVPTAGSDKGKAGGRPLMQALRAEVEAITGRKYWLTHCFHNSLRLGGSSERRRYFMVLSIAPFSVGVPSINRMPLLRDVVGDLPHFADPAISVPYATDGSWWAKKRRNRDGLVNGCSTFFDLYETSHGHRLYDAIGSGDWQQGEHMGEVLSRFWDDNGAFPGPAWTPQAVDTILHRPLQKNQEWNEAAGDPALEAAYAERWGQDEFPPSAPVPFQGGAYMPKRWREDHHAHVMAGNALWDVVHPTQDRVFTYREAARIMGFPDDWDVTPYWDNRNGSIVFGKGVVVDSGRWIGQAAKAFVERENLEDAGEEVGEREFIVSHQNLHRELYAKTYSRRKR